MTPGSVLVDIQDVSLAFGHQRESSPVFENFSASMRLDPGSPTILGGRNGIGKSVLARIIAGLQRFEGRRPILVRNGEPVSSGDVVYIPQNLEAGHDRVVEDLFASIAAVGRQLAPRGLRALLRAEGLDRTDLRTPCDRISKTKVLTGVFAAMRRSRAALLILDEPLAQVGRAERAEIDRATQRFAAESDIPLLVIAHPDQLPSAGVHLELCVRSDGSKELRPRRKPGAATQERPPCGPPSHRIELEGPSHVNVNLHRETINALRSPTGLAPARFGSLIAGAVRTNRDAVFGKWTLRLITHEPPVHQRPSVKFLPPDAQSAIVPNAMPLVLATLYDRWETAPRRPIARTVDRGAVRRGIYREGKHFLPIDPDKPELLGQQLSGGNRQMLAIRTIGYPLPDVLVVVAPYSGLDEFNVTRVHNFLDYAAESGTLVISIDHSDP